MDIIDVKAHIFYLSRELLYNTLLVKCNDYKNRYNTDTTLHFYHSLALILNRRYQEGIRELGILKSEMSSRLASTVALMYTHKFIKTDDKELFIDLDNEMRDARSSASSTDFYNTAYGLFVFGKYDKALDYIEKAINKDVDNCEFWNLKGWICIYLIQQNFRQNINISDMFKNAMKDNTRNLDASIGLSISFNMENNSEAALNAINKAVVRFPSNILPLIGKMNLLFSNYEWDQTTEILNRILDTDPNNLDAIRTQILILICRNGKYEEAAILLKRFLREMYEQEPKNALFYVEIAKLMSRVCNKNISILSETFKLVEKALLIAPGVPDFLTEMGYQALLQDDYKEASPYFKAVIKIDESSINALMGLTLCEFGDSKKKDHVKDQVEFLLELHEKDYPSLLLMKAKLLDNVNEIFKCLDKAVEEHMSLCKNYPYGPTYLKLLDPNVLLDITKEYLKFIPFSTDVSNFKTTPNIDKAIKASLNILKVLTKACPGSEEALYLQAKILYFKGDSVEAMKILDHIVKNLDSNFSDAFLLMAQIQISNSLFDRAAQSLEAGLSHNFKVRENPLYHLLSGLIEKNCGNLEDAVKHFTTALNLIDLKPKEACSKSNNFDSHIDFTLADKASIYTELIQVHTSLKQVHEATKLLQDATEEFRGTPEEAKITLISADHLIKNKDSQGAIDILSKIKASDAYYLQTKTKLAQIFLKQRKDRRAYLKCYEEMVENMPGSDSFVLLGDAYFNILELDKALDAYEKALSLNPTDPFLTKKMGEALVTTHHFQRAITYYKDTIKLTDNPELKLELAHLYVKLKQFDNAENFLKHEIEFEKNKNINDITALKYMTTLQSLLAQIYEKVGNIKETLFTLKSANENQQRLHKLYSMNQTEIPENEIETSIVLYKKMADAAFILRDPDQSIKYYKDALLISPNNCKILASLAKLYMQMNHMDTCQQICTTLLSIDPENEDGTVLMADIAFRKVDFDMAVYHFTQLLSKQPTNWRALVRFIEIMRRTGNLQGVFKYVDQAEKLCNMPSKDPGFCYCTGLYQWYSGNLNGALRNFNIARQNSEWNKLAICNMIEICLNPEDEIMGDQFIDIDDIEYKDSRSMALKTAERLLKELKQKIDATNEDPLKYKLFKNFLLLATKEKTNVEQALEDFISIASMDKYKEQVGPIYGIATAYTMLKQSQRAKNQLKRLVKNVWSFDDAEYLESCWLLLADYYMQSSKYDLAYELLKKILQHNRACSKAHEFYGTIAEKEQKYKEAALSYNQAWKYSGKSNPAIGYKLAYNFMKCKKYADAIDVCQQVLKQHPEYPKIKKDILDKALTNLRT